VLGNHSLQALHDYTYEGYGCVVTEAVCGRVFGNRDDDAGLQTCRDSSLCQEQVKQFGEDPCQLVCTYFNHCPQDAVQSSSFPGVHCFQIELT